MKIKYCLFFLGLFFMSSLNGQDDLAPKRSAPFSNFRFENEQIFVTVDDQEWEWMSMNDLGIKEIINYAKRYYETDWKEAIAEDLKELLDDIGRSPKLKEEFGLRNKNGQIIKKQLTFTKEKRAVARDNFAKNYGEQNIDFKKILSKDEMLVDLEFLKTTMEKKFSYFKRLPLDTDKLFDDFKEQSPAQQTAFDFGLQLRELITAFGDGHSRIRNVSPRNLGILPFQVDLFNGEIICHKNQALLDQDYPYLAAINGVEVKRLLEISDKYLTEDGSEAAQAFWRTAKLRNIGFILTKLAISTASLVVELKNENGDRKTINQTITKAPKRKRISNPFSTRMLEEDIAYIKIKEMGSSDAKGQIKAIFSQCENAKAFIIDVRDNPGGSRKIGFSLLPYFMGKSVDAVIGNLAKYRTDDPGHKEVKAIENRRLYPITSPRFDKNEQSLITQLMQDFEPKIAFDENKFSDWHYYIIPSNNSIDQRFRGMPVVVLMNTACFSATDIFLSSFDQLDNVTLMGTVSGGGSGRALKYRLPNSNVIVSLSSLLSFQPNGYLYEGRGVIPDVMVEQKQISDILGTTDYQLEMAVQHLKKK